MSGLDSLLSGGGLSNILGSLTGSGGGGGLDSIKDLFSEDGYEKITDLVTGGGSGSGGGGSGFGDVFSKLLGKTGIGDAVSGALGVQAPPPPSEEQRRAEVQQLHQYTDHRTPELDAKAEHLNEAAMMDLWLDEAKRYRDAHPGMEGYLGTAKVMGAVAAAAAGAFTAKGKYDLQRPFEIDPSITPLGEPPSDSSYPSGHSAAAVAATEVLASLWPERADYYRQLAKDVQWARMYSGVHLPSDIAAGEQIGKAAAEKFS